MRCSLVYEWLMAKPGFEGRTGQTFLLEVASFPHDRKFVCSTSI